MIIEVEKDSVAGQYARALDPLSMLLLVPLVALFWVGAFINILLPLVIIAMGPAWLLAICATKKRVSGFSLTWKITAVYIGGGLAAFAISTYTGGDGIASLLLGGLSIILTLLGLGIIQSQGRSIISTGLTFCLTVGMLYLGYICGIEQNGINEVPRGKAPEARALAIKQIQEIADKISEIKWQTAAEKIRAKDFAAAEQIIRMDIFDGKLLNRHERSKSFELRMRWEKEYGAILNEKSAQNIAKIKNVEKENSR